MRSVFVDSPCIGRDASILTRRAQVAPGVLMAKRRAAGERQPATVSLLPLRMTRASRLLGHAPAARNDNHLPRTPGSVVAPRRRSGRDVAADGMQLRSAVGRA